MRILHTADWHLGRTLHGQSLLDDQAHILDQFVRLAAERAVDLVVIAGDVYDRSVPPAEAVALLDEVLARLVVEAGIAVVLVAGNHDSAERIGFGGRICDARGLHLRGTLDDLSPVTLRDAHGDFDVFPLPYVEPAFARALPGGEAVHDHDSALRHVVAGLPRTPGRRSLLVAHAFVGGGEPSESERPLSVGGSGEVAADIFDGFDYVALGHLHRPQRVGGERIQYSGSLLKYSFNEAAQPKSVTLVELDAAGLATTERIALAPRRDLRIVEGTLAGLLAAPDLRFSRDDYLCARLTDDGPLLDPMARLREVYPNMLELQFVRERSGDAAARAAADHRRRQPDELFRAFYRDMTGQEIDAPRQEVFADALRTVAGEGAR